MKPKWKQIDDRTFLRKDGPCEMYVWRSGVLRLYEVILKINGKRNFEGISLIGRGTAKSLHAAKCAAVKAANELSHMLKDDVWLRAVKNAEEGK